MEQEKDYYFEKWKEIAQNSELRLPARPFHIKMENPKQYFISAYRFCLSQIGKEEEFKYTPEMDKICSWLEDNNNKGLLLFGNCGTGKTFFARYVFPLLFKAYYPLQRFPYYDMTYASRHTDEVLANSLLILDDIGCEQKFNDFGTIRDTLNEVVDSAEKEGKLLILTANLTGEEIKELYGERTFDRIRALCTQIPFTGTSFRSTPH